MKVLALLLLLACAPALALQASFTITATGGAPIPTAYSVSNTQSLVMSGLAYAKEVCVYNATTSKIAFSPLGTSTVAASSTPEVYVAGGSGICLTDPRYLGPISTVQVRSASGSTITSGDVWGWAR